MIYRPAYIVTFFLLLFSPAINAINWQLSWSDTPSIKVNVDLTKSCSTGIKINLEDINPLALYGLYNHYSELTHEQKISLLTNPNLFINTQAAFYVINKNEHVKCKAQIIKKSNIDQHVSLSSSHYINNEFSMKQHLLFHPNNTPEFDIAARYNKKIPNTLGVHIQGFIKNNEDPYIALHYSYTVDSLLGLRGSVLFKKDSIAPIMPKFFNPTKNGSPVVAVINTGLPCLTLVVQKELELAFPNKKQNAQYAQRIIENLDLTKSLLDIKINALKKELS
jgi:hypothetical protein